MRKPWSAEVEISAKDALEIIREQCADVEGQKISLLGVGWDNTAFLVDEKWVFRFPRRQIAVSLLSNEIHVLSHLKNVLPLKVPEVKWVGKWGNDDWPFMGYPLLAGITACRARCSDDERKGSAKLLGKFLKALHQIPLKVGEEYGLPSDTHEKVNADKRIPQIKANLQEIIDLKLLKKEEVARFQPILERAYRASEKRAIVHGDLYARHLLVDPTDHKVTAVIDWGDVHLGDPAADLAIVPGFLPLEARSLFWQEYGEVSEETWALARMRALYSTTTLMIYGCHVQDEALLEEGQRSLHYIDC